MPGLQRVGVQRHSVQRQLELLVVEGRSAIDWGIYGAPETFLVDRNGVVLWKHVGALTDEIIAGELMPALQKSEGAR